MSDAPVEINPRDLNFAMTTKTVEGITDALEAALHGGWSLETMRGAARYVASLAERTVIPVHVASPVVASTSNRWARGLAQRLPNALRVRLSPLKQALDALTAPAKPSGQETPSDESPIDVDDLGWEELIDRWLEWCDTPQSVAAEEDQVLKDFAAHVVERLAPWDGSEGALRGLHHFVKADGRPSAERHE